VVVLTPCGGPSFILIRAKLVKAEVADMMTNILTKHFTDSNIREPAFACLQTLLGDEITLTKVE